MNDDLVANVTQVAALLDSHDQNGQISDLVGVTGETCDMEQDCDCVKASDDCVKEEEEEEERVGESGIHHCSDGGLLVYLDTEGGNLVG